ncbi:MAG: C40 family peptidase [Clostridia bacterium]|nr:C40 family peptidase [Clostridia bacterium]
MASISAKDLIRSVESAMGWPYVSPGSNDCRGIDCSGLLVYAFRQNGGSIYHGSNTIARKYVHGLEKLTSAKQLRPGMAVFKWNPNTPSKFSDGRGDFQHVGVVTRTNPLRIVHASSAAGKVVADSKLGKWRYCAYLDAVDYGGGDMGILEDIAKMFNGQPAQQPATTQTDLQPTTQTDLGTSPSVPAGTSPQQAGEIGATRIVTAASGNTVRVREAPGGAKIAELPLGTRVTALGGKVDRSGVEWTKIRYEAEGWMMSKFLKGGV